MNVAAVEQHFRSLAILAEQAGASAKAVGELSAVAAALHPFESLGVAEFGVFLRRADDYARDGTLPVGPAKKTPPKPRPVKAAIVAPGEAIERVYALYETIVHGNHDDEAVAKELLLVMTLKKTDLQKLAEKLHIWQSIKKLGVPEIKAKIQEEVRERKNRFERSDY